MASWNRANQPPLSENEKKRFFARFNGDPKAPGDITKTQMLGILVTSAEMYERQMERWGSGQRAVAFLDTGDNLHVRNVAPEELGEIAATKDTERKVTVALAIGPEALRAAIGFIEPTEGAFVAVSTEPLTRVPRL